jgi:predicted permease
MKAFRGLMHIHLGYDPHNVMAVGIPLHNNSYTTWAARAAYFEQLRAKVAETPGVTMAAISLGGTPPRSGWEIGIEILGRPSIEQPRASISLVGRGYFSTLGISLLAGRLWSEAEEHNGAYLAVINETMARLYFPKSDAIGHSLRVPVFDRRAPFTLAAPGADSWLEIVGIAGDSVDAGLRDPIQPQVFAPYTLIMPMGTQILVRSEVPPLSLLRAVRTQLSSVNPDQQVYSVVEDLEQRLRNYPEWGQGRLVAWLFGAFAALALVLAAIGLYSVVSYSVAQRTNEFGIRLALGAQRGDVLRIVFASTLMSVGGGVVAGLTLTFALNPVLTRWAGGSSRDQLILIGTAFLLGTVAAVASAVPARRAASVDPVTALRYE